MTYRPGVLTSNMRQVFLAEQVRCLLGLPMNVTRRNNVERTLRERCGYDNRLMSILNAEARRQADLVAAGEMRLPRA